MTKRRINKRKGAGEKTMSLGQIKIAYRNLERWRGLEKANDRAYEKSGYDPEFYYKGIDIITEKAKAQDSYFDLWSQYEHQFEREWDGEAK